MLLNSKHTTRSVRHSIYEIVNRAVSFVCQCIFDKSYYSCEHLSLHLRKNRIYLIKYFNRDWIIRGCIFHGPPVNILNSIPRKIKKNASRQPSWIACKTRPRRIWCNYDSFSICLLFTRYLVVFTMCTDNIMTPSRKTFGNGATIW